jgi:hypothetical protein
MDLLLAPQARRAAQPSAQKTEDKVSISCPSQILRGTGRPIVWLKERTQRKREALGSPLFSTSLAFAVMSA